MKYAVEPATGRQTPAAFARRMREDETWIWLDSAQTGPGSVSVIGRAPWRRLALHGTQSFVDGVMDRRPLWDLLQASGPDDPLPGPDTLFGFLAYEAGMAELGLTPLPFQQEDPVVPDAAFFCFDEVLVWEHESGRIHLRAGGHLRPEEESLAALRRLLREAPAPERVDPEPAPAVSLYSSVTPEQHMARVERIRQYIGAGDVCIVNLARRLSGQATRTPLETYLRLRFYHPVPYGAYLSVGSQDLPAGLPAFALLSASMELFLQIRHGEAVTRPIKGTRPRGATPEEDHRLEEELRHSVKDRAELLMTVDLERNDMSRVCTPESVRVRELYRVLPYAAVFHMDAEVLGTLRPECGVADALKVMFPGGSITGAPKKRAMEIIAELEQIRRGPYTGCLGWIGPGRSGTLSILIRTLVRQNNRGWYATGGGITWDSDPAAEFEETADKARFLERIL